MSTLSRPRRARYPPQRWSGTTSATSVSRQCLPPAFQRILTPEQGVQALDGLGGPGICQPPIETTGTPVRTASAISLMVPQLPPTAISASLVRTSSALRISPSPVGMDTVR